VQLKSTITCPDCGHQATETMRTGACQFFYNCTGCERRLKPKPGDCCVFCSFGSVACPSMQEARVTAATACHAPAQMKADWVADVRTNALAWWLPTVAVFAALLAPVPVRVGIWAVMFAWMGAACILNSRRCGRTHCRYTGPYYLAMTVPVLALGIAPVLITLTGWFAIAVTILLGSKLIRWATERAWGKFSLS